jgi:hypothetical protein
MGVLDKTILLFDRPFWSPTDFISREAADRSGLWTTWLNYNTTLRLPALVALNAGGTARALEAQADGEVVASLLRVLRAMYPGEGAVPEPRQALVTRWAADPWARGSYSYFAVGNPKNITGAPRGRRRRRRRRRPAAAPGTACGCCPARAAPKKKWRSDDVHLCGPWRLQGSWRSRLGGCCLRGRRPARRQPPRWAPTPAGCGRQPGRRRCWGRPARRPPARGVRRLAASAADARARTFLH